MNPYIVTMFEMLVGLAIAFGILVLLITMVSLLSALVPEIIAAVHGAVYYIGIKPKQFLAYLEKRYKKKPKNKPRKK